MNFCLRPKNVIVIGGASGIGYATTQKLLDNGVQNVIIASRNRDKLESARQKLSYSAEQKVYALEFDISKIISHDDLIKKAQAQIGTIPDGLVISSGVVYGGNDWKGFNISETDWDKVMDTNLKGVFFLMRT